MIRETLAVGSVAVVLLASAAARAQSSDAAPASDAARADALFNAGKQLRDAGQWTDACPNFAESKRLAPGVGISLYLADCYEHVGRTSNAYQEFRSAERLARERNDKRADTAHTRALALEPKLGGLLIAVPQADRETPEILLDGTRVPQEQLNVAMTVDPGDHVVTVNAPGQPPRTLKAHVDAGYRPTTVQVEEPTATPPAPARAAAPPAEATAVAVYGTNRAVRTWAGIALTTAGVAGIGIGTWLAMTAPTPQPACVPPPEDNRTTVEAVAYAVGAATLIGGIVILAVNPHKSATGMTVSPMMVTSGAGAAFRTAF